MTKKELMQLRDLKREIIADQKRLKMLESKAYSPSASRYTGLPYVKGVTDNTGKYTDDLTKLRGHIDANVRRCFNEINKLTKYINTIEDSQVRRIFTLRYINGLSWQKIAFEIGETDEQYPRRKHNRYLANIKDDENDEFNNV